MPVFRHEEQIVVGMLPGVSRRIMCRGAAAGELIVDLPERLAFQMLAMAGRADRDVNSLAFIHEFDVVGIGIVRRQRLRSGVAGNESCHERGGQFQWISFRMFSAIL